MSNMKNQAGLATRANQTTISTFLTQKGVQQRINQMLGEKDGQKLITSIVSAVNTNPALAECDNSTILSAAMTGAALNLPPSPQLGQFYMVPFDDNNYDRKVATFVLGYKGYIQLAIRSGYYTKLNVLAIKQGELISFNPLEETIQVKLIEDDTVREETPTIGYYAMFEYTNGFKKAMYWSKAKMESHALKYSNGYRADKRKNTRYTFWSKDFDGMAYKTMLRQLISKWGIMSVELQQAYEADNAVIRADGTFDYVDSTPTPEPAAAISQDATGPEPSPKEESKVEAPQEQGGDDQVPADALKTYSKGMVEPEKKVVEPEVVQPASDQQAVLAAFFGDDE